MNRKSDEQQAQSLVMTSSYSGKRGQGQAKELHEFRKLNSCPIKLSNKFQVDKVRQVAGAGSPIPDSAVQAALN